jgi:glyoxylase I family protein
VQRTPDEENGDFLMMPTAGGISLIFFKNADMKPGQTPTVVYTLEEGGIDAVVAGLARKGATIVTPVSHSPGGWSADLADPNGHLFSIYQTTDVPR